MTQDEIISMAREVGAPGWWTGETDSNVPGRDWLSRFAALVAAKAAAEEREACAQLAAQTVCDLHIPTGVKIYGARAAKAIRARGTKPRWLEDEALIRQMLEAMEALSKLALTGEPVLWTAEFDRARVAVDAARLRLEGKP